MAQDDHKKTQANKEQQAESNHYDVSFDYPTYADQKGHSDQLDTRKKTSESSNYHKWDNFYDDFKQKQRQQYLDSKHEKLDVASPSEEVESSVTSDVDVPKKHPDDGLAKHEQKTVKNTAQSQQTSQSPRGFTNLDKKNTKQDKVDQAETMSDSTTNQPNKASQPSPKMTQKTSVMLDRSIRHARTLFNSLNEENQAPAYNPYKSDVVDDYLKRKEDASNRARKKREEQQKQRLDDFIQQSSSLDKHYQKNKVVQEKNKQVVAETPEITTVKQTELTKEKDLSPVLQDKSMDEKVPQKVTQEVPQEVTEEVTKTVWEEENKPTHAAVEKQPATASTQQTDLPSPDDIAKERERRRKERIAQLENIHSDEELKQTYRPNYADKYTQPTDEKQKKVKTKPIRPAKNTLKQDQDTLLKPDTAVQETVELTATVAAVEHNEPEKDNHATTKIISRKALTRKGKLTDNTVYLDTTELKDALSASTKDFSRLASNQISQTLATDNEAKDLTINESQAVGKTKSFKLWPFKGRSHKTSETVNTQEQTQAIVPTDENDPLVELSSFNPADSTAIDVTPKDEATKSVETPDEIVAATETDKGSSPKVLSYTEVEPILIEEHTDSRSSKKAEQKQKRKNKYSLAGLNVKEKSIFGFNVFFNVVKRLAIYLIILVIFGGVAAVGAATGYFAYLVSETTPPTEAEMAADIHRLEQQSVLYYGNGEPIASIRSDVVRTAVALEDVSPYIIDGLIATEDEYFYEHPGVMPKAIIRAALQEVISPGTGTGGSTITQQLVKQQMLSNDVTFFRKANEILLALRLENYFDKDEILAAYLNVSPFGRNNNGDNVAGIDKASEGIFGVNPDEVNLPQAAFLIGLPQDPYTYTPYDQYGTIREDLQPGIDRMQEVLYRMYRDQKISQAEYEEAITYDITQDFLPTEPREEERQSYLYQAIMNGAIEQLMHLNVQADGAVWDDVNADVERYNEYYTQAEEQLRIGGYRVYGTIDREIYDQLQISAQEYINDVAVSYDGVYEDPETGEQFYYVEDIQNGLVVIENQTGRVLGFVAGTDYENNQIDHAFGMHRSPGSTIKPLAVYGPAIQHNIINPASIIPDTTYVQTFEDGTSWAPTNYGSVVSGDYLTARTALYRSDNIPAVRIYEQLLNQDIPVIDYLERMGFDTVDSYTAEDTSYLAFSLGGVTTGPTVFEQTRAFTTFANNGQYVDGYYIERIEDSYGNIVYQHDNEPVEVFSEDSNYLMIDMLRDTNVEGTGRTAGEQMTMAGDWIAKSGISENSKDVWYIASTPTITIGSWLGYDSRFYDYTIDVNDGYDRESVRSQRYWARVVNDLYALRPEIFGVEQTFQQPDSVQEQTILSRTGTLPGSITVGGVSINISQPVTTDLFKLSNPASNLSYNFMVGGNDETHAAFWNTYVAEERERQRQESIQRQQNANSSSSSNNGESSSVDETTESQDETNTDTPSESQDENANP
ncbi:transglycosylase domain-containing protein [Fundicoccus culcitae]|uniref:Penicillin-binding protein n=1 Tax=Fundicoccus culcitae TaxID=2969821 RepID=A0ABY5P7D8_9LACT|nr:transglycosylase domain-containing protein [Fundicoccus culcitae]UUX34318.1 penicillin-binding protein [Fundicoccus culcitae]